MDTQHEFDDRAYVRKWAETADERRPERAPMFRRIVELLKAFPAPAPHVLELGCGPGSLGEVVLSGIPLATYDGIDYSAAMLELAQERLARFGTRARLHCSDLRRADWMSLAANQPQAIVTNQALHDLGTAEAVQETYQRVFSLLPGGGLFINAELVVPETGSVNKPGKLPLARHISMLEQIGFTDVHAELAFGEYVAIVARMPGAMTVAE
jgi:cyclopropane fatty-acyl-phospholipid synthase-like methyltransferase